MYVQLPAGAMVGAPRRAAYVLLCAMIARGEGPGGDGVLRATCPNQEYRLWSARLYGPLYDKDPDYCAPPACGADVHALFGGARMLEVGGPTPGTNIYDALSGADNVMQRNHAAYFAQFDNGRDDVRHNRMASDYDDAAADVDGEAYAPRGAAIGRIIQRHGARLRGVGDASYDLVMSSHSLEHFVDPLEALSEWDRVLRPGGSLLLVLPSVLNCTDKHNKPITMQELLHLRQASLAYDDAEWDKLVGLYFENYVRLFADVDPYDPWDMHLVNSTDDRRARIRAASVECGVDPENPATCVLDENRVHWHAWDFDVLREAVEGCLGYELLLLTLQPPTPPAYCPWHQVLIARKPNRSGGS